MRPRFAQVRWRIAGVHQHFVLVQSASAPVRSRSAPVQSVSAHVRWDFAVVRQRFALVHSASAHVQSVSAHVHWDFAVVRQHFAPVQSASAPVRSRGAPVQCAVHLPPAVRGPLPERAEPNPGTSVQKSRNKSLRPSFGLALRGNVTPLPGSDARGRAFHALHDGCEFSPQFDTSWPVCCPDPLSRRIATSNPSRPVPAELHEPRTPKAVRRRLTTASCPRDRNPPTQATAPPTSPPRLSCRFQPQHPMFAMSPTGAEGEQVLCIWRLHAPNGAIDSPRHKGCQSRKIWRHYWAIHLDMV